MNDRVILHCDCNSFYASVEMAEHPEYKNIPLAVCGSTEDRHGIVLAKNEVAKKYNIQTAETVYSALKKCPTLKIVEPHHEKYLKYSRLVNEIYHKYTDKVEPFGIDESWLDVTKSQKLFGSGMEIAEKIRQEVKSTLNITISVGVSFNKVFAKLGSDYKKPDAITEILKSNYKEIVYPMPASSLLFVGKRTETALRDLDIFTIGDLAKFDKNILIAKLGKMGKILHEYANGEDTDDVSAKREDAKSISNGLTFKRDLVTYDEYKIGIMFLSEEIGRKLRHNNQKCQTVGISIKDKFLKVIHKQATQKEPTDLSKEIADSAFKLFISVWEIGNPVRTITITASNLIKAEESARQVSFFSDEQQDSREKNTKIENALDKIKQKYGSKSIISGSLIGSDLGIYDTKDGEDEFSIKE